MVRTSEYTVPRDLAGRRRNASGIMRPLEKACIVYSCRKRLGATRRVSSINTFGASQSALIMVAVLSPRIRSSDPSSISRNCSSSRVRDQEPSMLIAARVFGSCGNMYLQASSIQRRAQRVVDRNRISDFVGVTARKKKVTFGILNESSWRDIDSLSNQAFDQLSNGKALTCFAFRVP